MYLIRVLCLTIAGLASMTHVNPAQAEDLAIPGGGNPEYVLEQLAKAFNGRQARHRITVPKSTGTAGALRGSRPGRPASDVSASRSRMRNVPAA